MTFLNPLYLIALAAAAIPIILHLLNLRKTRVIEFSTLSFLKELQKSKIRILKLRQLLLLVLRTLIIVFIVMAFSRPAVRGSIGSILGSHAKSSVVIILDNSFSMLANDDGGQLLKQAKAGAKNIIGLLQPGDEAALITLSTQHKDRVQFTAAHSAILHEIDRVQGSFTHIPMLDAVTAAHILLSKSQNFNKEIFVITDEQRSHFIQNDPTASTVPLFDESIKIFLCPLGNRQVNNTAIISAVVQNSLFEKNKPVTVGATILNYGSHPMRNEVVSLYLSGERVMQKSIGLEAGAKRGIDFTVVPKTIGFIDGFVQVEDDELPEDNRRYFSFHVPEQINILFASEKVQQGALLRAALSPGESSGGDNTFVVTSVDGNQLLSSNLKKYDVVVIVAGKYITSSFSDRLSSYVKDGGSVFLFPGDAAESIQFLHTLASALKLPPINDANGTLGSKSSYSQFGKIDFDHPLFAGLFVQGQDKKPPKIESPRIFFNTKLQAFEKAHAVISTSSGQPFLLDYPYGEGRVLICAVAPILSWSDFPLKGIFAPLMNRSIYYLSSRGYSSLVHSVGESFEMMLPYSNATASIYSLKAPDGNEIRIAPKALGSGLYFPISSLDAPGNYKLVTNEKTLRVIPLNVDASESDLTKMTKQERTAYWKSVGGSNIVVLSPSTDLHRAVMQTRFGLELWKYFLVAALACALFEMMIARDVKRKMIDATA